MTTPRSILDSMDSKAPLTAPTFSSSSGLDAMPSDGFELDVPVRVRKNANSDDDTAQRRKRIAKALSQEINLREDLEEEFLEAQSEAFNVLEAADSKDPHLGVLLATYQQAKRSYEMIVRLGQQE
jgi:hypothetical protein